MPFDEILTNVKPCELPVGLCAQAWSTTTAPSGAPPRSSIKPGKFNPLPSKHQRNKSWNKNEKIILLDQKLMLFYFKLNQINSNQLESQWDVFTLHDYWIKNPNHTFYRILTKITDPWFSLQCSGVLNCSLR